MATVHPFAGKYQLASVRFHDLLQWTCRRASYMRKLRSGSDTGLIRATRTAEDQVKGPEALLDFPLPRRPALQAQSHGIRSLVKKCILALPLKTTIDRF